MYNLELLQYIQKQQQNQFRVINSRMLKKNYKKSQNLPEISLLPMQNKDDHLVLFQIFVFKFKLAHQYHILFFKKGGFK